MNDTKSSTVIKKLKAHFARYGIPSEVVSDNAPQYTSEKFKQFEKSWDFDHILISSRNSQANGKAESAVKTVKRIMKRTAKSGYDPYLGLLDHRNTSTQGFKRVLLSDYYNAALERYFIQLTNYLISR